ncbi:MAG: hypothetical protein Q9O62_01420 [Ardenticatenia bacterium]|nr:hypothetical protein [Ardenticatenia bacterium]
MMLPLALVATLHDPDSRQARLLEPVALSLAETFQALIVAATPNSAHDTVRQLRAIGATVLQEQVPEGWHMIGRARRQLLETALDQGHRHMLLCDFDRLLHWLEVAPEELSPVAAQIRQHDFLVLGRTPSAFDTHPAVQRDTERLANHVFAQVTGRRWDITGGARGLTADAAEFLVRHGRVDSLGVDAEWPILLLRAGQRVGYLEVNGLSFETADRFADLIAQCGGYGAWLTRHVNTPAGWVHRLGLAHEIARAAVEASAVAGSPVAALTSQVAQPGADGRSSRGQIRDPSP